MKKPDLTKYKTTSTLYLLILIIAAVALIFGWRCTSSSLSNRSADLHIRTLPSRCVKISKTTTVYRISDVRWTKKASTASIRPWLWKQTESCFIRAASNRTVFCIQPDVIVKWSLSRKIHAASSSHSPTATRTNRCLIRFSIRAMVSICFAMNF